MQLFSPPSTAGRSEGIDLLRGLLALQVLFLAHLPGWGAAAQPGSVPEALTAAASATALLFQRHGELNPAVLAFIVLSGYCVHRNGLRPGSSLAAFCIRRVFRIFPVFLLATGAGLAGFQLAMTWNAPLTMGLSGTQTLSGACLAAKLSTVATLWPLAHPCSFLGNAPLLTVAVEIALYAAYAALAVLARPCVVLGLCALSVFVGILISTRHQDLPLLYNWWQNSSLLAFLPYWWIGAAAVLPEVRRALGRTTIVLVLVWTGLTAATFMDTSAVSAEVRKLVLALLAARLIIWVDEAAIAATPLSRLGRTGYSLYALHAPVCILLLAGGWNWWQSGLTAVAVGILCHMSFERPLDRLGHRLSRRFVQQPVTLAHP